MQSCFPGWMSWFPFCNLATCWWDGPTSITCTRLFMSRRLGSATWSSWDRRHNWHIPLDKVFRASTTGVNLCLLLLWETAMSWGDQPSWAKPSALFPQLRICILIYMGVLPWVQSCYMKMQRRWQERNLSQLLMSTREKRVLGEQGTEQLLRFPSND